MGNNLAPTGAGGPCRADRGGDPATGSGQTRAQRSKDRKGTEHGAEARTEQKRLTSGRKRQYREGHGVLRTRWEENTQERVATLMAQRMAREEGV